MFSSGEPVGAFEEVVTTAGRLGSCRRAGELTQEMSLRLSNQNKYDTVGTA